MSAPHRQRIPRVFWGIAPSRARSRVCCGPHPAQLGGPGRRVLVAAPCRSLRRWCYSAVQDCSLRSELWRRLLRRTARGTGHPGRQTDWAGPGRGGAGRGTSASVCSSAGPLSLQTQVRHAVSRRRSRRRSRQPTRTGWELCIRSAAPRSDDIGKDTPPGRKHGRPRSQHVNRKHTHTRSHTSGTGSNDITRHTSHVGSGDQNMTHVFHFVPVSVRLMANNLVLRAYSAITPFRYGKNTDKLGFHEEQMHLLRISLVIVPNEINLRCARFVVSDMASWRMYDNTR